MVGREPSRRGPTAAEQRGDAGFGSGRHHQRPHQGWPLGFGASQPDAARRAT
jgi:hypothetical protein